MNRITRKILTALSLLPCAFVVAFWVHSYWVQPPPATYADRWLYSHGYVASGHGLLTIVYFDDTHGTTRPFDYRHWQIGGFSFDRWQGISGWNSGCQYTSARVPHWALFLLTAIPLPIIIARMFRRRAAAQSQRLCPACRYDLRAHHPGNKCPECGTTIPTKNSATMPSDTGDYP